MTVLARLAILFSNLFAALERGLDGWFLQLSARLAFAGVLMVHYLNAAWTKIGSGFPDMFVPQAGAYAQMLPKVAESVSYNIDNIAFFPHGLIVWGGTYAEFILPVLVVLGLFTRLSALAMITFIAVQTYVDVAFHGLDDTTVGAWFNRLPGELIADQRTLWVAVLLILVVKGGGVLSLDRLIYRRLTRPSEAAF